MANVPNATISCCFLTRRDVGFEIMQTVLSQAKMNEL